MRIKLFRKFVSVVVIIALAMAVIFLNTFLCQNTRGKSFNLPEVLVYLSMYINFLDLYIKLLEWKFFNTENKDKKFEYCTTLAVLDGELDIYRNIHSEIKESRKSEDVSFRNNLQCSADERLRLCVTFGMRCRQKYRLTDLKEFRVRAKGIEGAVKILLSIRKDVENCYHNSRKKKSSQQSILRRLFNLICL